MNNFFPLLRNEQHYQRAKNKSQGMSKGYVIEFMVHSKLDYKRPNNYMRN